LFVACCDAPEVFDFEEEALDEVAFAVERVVAVDLWGGGSGRDDCDRVLSGDDIAERFRVIAFVAEDMIGWQIGDQSLGVGVVTGLTGRENEPEGVAQGIDDGVDLGGQPAA
jgi:hypothetical protein